MAYVSIFMFPDNRRLIQFRCNQLIHRTGTKYLVILAVKSLGKESKISEKSDFADVNSIQFRRLTILLTFSCLNLIYSPVKEPFSHVMDLLFLYWTEIMNLFFALLVTHASFMEGSSTYRRCS